MNAVGDVARGNQIALFDEVKNKITFPFRVTKTLVIFRRPGHRQGFQTGGAAHGVLPQGDKLLPHRHLCLGDFKRMGEHSAEHVFVGGAYAQIVAGRPYRLFEPLAQAAADGLLDLPFDLRIE